MRTYATIGPACADRETLAAMLRRGLTGFRLNLSHTTLPDCADWLNNLRLAGEQVGRKPELIIDLRGGEVRIGALREPLVLKEGEHITLGEEIPVASDVLAALKDGWELLLDDGAMALTVEQGARCRVTRGGVLTSHKSLTLPIELPRPIVSEEDRADLRVAAQYGVTAVMQPFVRSRADLEEVRAALHEYNLDELEIFAKVEDAAGLASLPEWMELCDTVTVARGDLGSNLPLWTLPKVQKKIAAQCRAAGKPFLVVTQLLWSMIENPTPTRAEVSDIYNAVLDGASALMLTNETAQGKHPAEAVDWLMRVIEAAAGAAEPAIPPERN